MPSAAAEGPDGEPVLYEDAFSTKEIRYGEIVSISGSTADDGTQVPPPPLKTGQKVLVAPVDGVKYEPDGRDDADSLLYLFKVSDVIALA